MEYYIVHIQWHSEHCHLMIFMLSRNMVMRFSTGFPDRLSANKSKPIDLQLNASLEK